MTSVDSPFPRDYRLHCKLFTDDKLDEQYRRHTRGAESGCRTAAACLREVRQELLRRQQPGYKLRQESLRQRQAQRRSEKRARRAKRG